jgi:hypothetical protein
VCVRSGGVVCVFVQHDVCLEDVQHVVRVFVAVQARVFAGARGGG